ncbi:MAG: ABC transporter ATP-binding protein [Spirochaetales bacterium]|nr:ABC transporter ATP-binding protein [Spirochaetales bacterium]
MWHVIFWKEVQVKTVDTILEVKELTKIFHSHSLLKGLASINGKKEPGESSGNFKAVDKVSFNVKKNTVFGLVGESGCGKTTLARSILYLDPPTSGDVIIDGINLKELSSRELRLFRKRIQIVFQDPNSSLNPKLTIKTSLEEGLKNQKYPRNQISERVDELLEHVGIPASYKTRYPHEFSGGQKQRMVIARALTLNPDFLVLDEPVSNLDVSIQAQIINLLMDLKKQFSLTYLFISHDLNLVSYLSDEVGVMYKGRIVERGSVLDIMKTPLHPYTKKLLFSIPGNTEKYRNKEEAELFLNANKTASSAFSRPLTGCPYYSECPVREDICLEEKPELRAVSSKHTIACINDIYIKYQLKASKALKTEKNQRRDL